MEKDSLSSGWTENEELFKYRRYRGRDGKFISLNLNTVDEEPLGISVVADEEAKKLLEVNFDKSSFTKEEAKHWLDTHSTDLLKGEIKSMNEEDLKKAVDKAIEPLQNKITELEKANKEDSTETDEELEAKKKAEEEEVAKKAKEDEVKKISEMIVKATQPLLDKIEALEKARKKPSNQTSEIETTIKKMFESDTVVDLGNGKQIEDCNEWGNIPALSRYDKKTVNKQATDTGGSLEKALAKMIDTSVKKAIKEVHPDG